jgi:hypothetical protein
VIGTPFTSSITKYGRPFAVAPPSSTLAMFGWSISASAWRSASNRTTTSRVSMPSLTIFSATLRTTGSRCSAIHTVPMPPSPMHGLEDAGQFHGHWAKEDTRARKFAGVWGSRGRSCALVDGEPVSGEGRRGGSAGGEPVPTVHGAAAKRSSGHARQRCKQVAGGVRGGLDGARGRVGGGAACRGAVRARAAPGEWSPRRR